jgi:Icc protein
MILAQISDLHVRPQGMTYNNAVDSNRMLADAIEHLNRLDPQPDVVLITGDLVEKGLDAEYAMLRTLLNELAAPFLLMPGNHDDRERLAGAFPEHDYLPSRGPKHYTIDRYPVRILALDTTVPGKHHGEVDEKGLAWLEASLAATGAAPAIVMMHHPPIASGIPYIDTYMCREPERIAAVISRFPNVERVLCGHIHRPILQRWAGTVLCTCPSTATQIALQLRPDARPASYAEPPACLLHLWRDGVMLTHTSYIGHYEGPFPFA